MVNNQEGLTIMEGNMYVYSHMEKTLDECLQLHTKACYNWVGGNWLSQFEGKNEFATTLNAFKYILATTIDDDIYRKGEIIEDEDNVESNEEGLNNLIANVRAFNNKEITLKELINNHIKICAKELNGYKRHFSDGWRKDIYLNILQYVIRAERGDEKAMDRLEIDLHIKDCIMTIKKIED